MSDSFFNQFVSDKEIRAAQIYRNWWETGIARDDMGYDEEGYDEEGYDRDGLDKNGCDRNGVYDRFLFMATEHLRECLRQEEHERQCNANPDGRDDDGYDWDGYDRDGYDRNGLDRDFRNRQGVYISDGPRWNVILAAVDPNYTPRPPEDVMRRYLEMLDNA